MTESASSFSALRRYVIVLRRQWWLIASAVVLALASSFAYVEHKHPVYASQMKIVVGQGQALFVPNVSNAVQPFTQTMTDLIQSNVIAKETIERLGLTMKPNVLISHMSVSSPPEASVLQVTYEDPNRALGTRTLAMIGQVFTEQVDTRLGGSAKPNPKVTGGESVSAAPVSATVFDPSHSLPGQISPKPARTYVVAALLGLIAGILLAFLRDALASRMRNEDEAQEAYGAPVVGSLPRGTIGITPAQVALIPGKFSARLTESVEVLAATLRYSRGQTDGGVILVVSAQPEEGKSTVASHLAASISSGGSSVIAVDADLRRPSLWRFFDLDPAHAGLADVLAGEAELADVLVQTPSEQTRLAAMLDQDEQGSARRPNSRRSRQGRQRGNGSLLILGAGTHRQNPVQVLSLGGAAQLVAQMRKMADYIVIDTPPLLAFGDVFPLIQLADMVVVVSRQGASKREHAWTLRERLAALGAGQFSVVVTEADTSVSGYDGYTYRHEGTDLDAGHAEQS